MKISYWIISILILVSSKLFSQEVRVNNSFIILVNDKLTTTVEGARLILSDSTGRKESINCSYYPGVLSVRNIETKEILYADTVRKLTLAFDDYEYGRDKQFIHNYKINIERRWFKESLIIVKIYDINKRSGTYRYTFEVPGYSFGKVLKQ